MSMEISGIGSSGHGSDQTSQLHSDAARAQRARAQMKAAQPTVQIRNATEELQSVSMIFNRRLEFEVNRDLERVVVKVIDRETDKVIKELPPEEIQRLHVRIREAIGLLVDEEI
jgi:flagellar protein FlaG